MAKLDIYQINAMTADMDGASEFEKALVYQGYFKSNLSKLSYTKKVGFLMFVAERIEDGWKMFSMFLGPNLNVDGGYPVHTWSKENVMDDSVTDAQDMSKTIAYVENILFRSLNSNRLIGVDQHSSMSHEESETSKELGLF